MNRTACALLVMVLLAGAEAKEERLPLDWPNRGYASLLDAAADAKNAKERLLIGLSGSPH